MKTYSNKKILLLGGAAFQVPAIEKAKEIGIKTIVCDNRPDNPGHRIADISYSNVSTLDIEKVLDIAQKEQIHGALSFGSDVAARTAAIVAKELNIPGNSPTSIETLTNKHLFRSFLNKEKIQESFYKEIIEPISFDQSWNEFLPLIIKPVDSSGSKGVHKVTHENLSQFKELIKNSLFHSIQKKVIIEEFIEKVDYQICGDGYFQEGKIAFVHYGNGYFNEQEGLEFTPYAESFPSHHPKERLQQVTNILEEILQKVGFTQGAFNLDVIIRPSGKPYIIEIGPRNGGNYIPTTIYLNTNVNLIEASVKGAIDPSYKLRSTPSYSKSFYASYMLHSFENNKLNSITFDKCISQYIFKVNPYLENGSEIQSFTSANKAIGNVILKFEDQKLIEATIKSLNKFINYN